MRTSMIAAGLLACCATAAASTSPQDDPARAATARFAGLTAGLSPGRSQQCVLRSGYVVDAVGSRLIYRVHQNLIYVNQATQGCERVANGDALIRYSGASGRVCSGDRVRTESHAPIVRVTGTCALGPFIPYRKP